MNSPNFHLLPRPNGQAPAHDPAAARERLLAAAPVRTGRHLKETASLYRPSEPLRIAINTALAVGAPLLLTGDPGTGKTQVAYYLGWFFGIEVFEYQVTSQARAEDLRFEYDAVAYLRSAGDKDEAERQKPREAFRRKRALWQAYDHPEPSIVLIDEIDKAPRDFPNDLLKELDQHEFEDPFTGAAVRPQAARAPIIVITSNAERRLPEAFLRRCVFHHIELTPGLFMNAVEAHRAELYPTLPPTAIDTALRRFHELRNITGLRKTPSTAELLTWLAVLALDDGAAARVDGAPLRELPGLQTLIKDADDLKKVPATP